MKTSKCVLVLLAVVLLAGVVQGELKPVGARRGDALMQQPLHTSRSTKPKEGDGTVNKKALIAKFAKQNISVAIDSKSPDAKEFDVVRFDFTGKGKFDDKLIIPLKKRNVSSLGMKQGQIGPATLQINRDGKTIPVNISGHYYIASNHKCVMLQLGTALEGSCKFGDKTYKVRIVDGNNNLRFGDKSHVRLQGVTPGDTLLVDVGDGQFKQHANIKKSLYGSRALVDGVWYDVKLAKDGSEITAIASTAKTAKLKIDHDNWSAQLAGKSDVLMLSGSTEPVEIPAGKYTIIRFSQSRWGKNGRMDTISISRQTLMGWKSKRIDAQAGQTVALNMGSPLTARVKIKSRGRSLMMSFEATDVAGLKVDAMYNAKPQVEVFDDTGKLVHTGKFEYG